MGCNSSSVCENESVRNLFSKVDLGHYTLKNRVMMGAMTRMRTPDGVPNEWSVKYFTERAEDAGLVLTDCCAVLPNGEGYPGNHQAFDKKHFDGWKKVVDSVHKVNGKIFIQLYHCGRSTNSKVIGEQPVAPSVVKNRDDTPHMTYDEPRELSVDEIKKIVKAFGEAAKMAKDVGFDGVEIHGANGYIVDQFLRDCTNKREDDYGGSVEKRSKFCLEVVDEIISVLGAKRVGIKLSPIGRFCDMYDSDPKKLLEYLLPELNKRKIAFVEIMKGGDEDKNYNSKPEEQYPNMLENLKPLLPNVILVGNQKIKPEEANLLIAQKKIDMVSFATNYISNPDLCERLKKKWPIENVDWSKVFGGNEVGYCDYPKYSPPKTEGKTEEKK